MLVRLKSKEREVGRLTYVGVVLDLLEGRLVELSGIAVETRKVVGGLNTGQVAAAQAALVHIVDPAQVRLGLLSRNGGLEDDNVLALDVDRIAALLDGAGGGEGGEAEEETELSERDHFE